MTIVTAIWKPAWYELDQSIKVGLNDVFELIKSSDVIKFYTGSDNEKPDVIKGEILSIEHKTLGKIIEIDTIGLVYKIVLDDGTPILIEAEETPGKIENDYPEFDNDNYRFTVKIKIDDL